jgi:16S rRNA (uracil1498-N3)-methyltransferase
MNFFYAPDLELHSEWITLNYDESRHCLRSMRMRQGDLAWMGNGRGLQAEVELDGTEANLAVFRVLKCEQSAKRPAGLHLAVAPTKNHDRIEWMVEKATELGVATITPLICRHSERTRVQRDRLERLLIAAMKQSRDPFLPEIFAEKSFDSLVKEEFSGQKFIAWCGNERPPHLKDLLGKGSHACILIGPEGDFSDDEIKLARERSYEPVSLGYKRLRTETAAIFACSVFNMIND